MESTLCTYQNQACNITYIFTSLILQHKKHFREQVKLQINECKFRYGKRTSLNKTNKKLDAQVVWCNLLPTLLGVLNCTCVVLLRKTTHLLAQTLPPLVQYIDDSHICSFSLFLPTVQWGLKVIIVTVLVQCCNLWRLQQHLTFLQCENALPCP